MQSRKVGAALNNQINEEIQSAYIYLAMSAEVDRLNLAGTSPRDPRCCCEFFCD